MIMTNADRVFAQNWVEQYRTNFYNDPDNAHRTALQFVQSRYGRGIIGGAFYWSGTEVHAWARRGNSLSDSFDSLIR